MLRTYSFRDLTFRFGLSRHSQQVVQKSRSIWQWEEETSLVWHVDHFISFSSLLFLGHSLGLICDLILGRALCRNYHCWLSDKETGNVRRLGTYSRIDGPFALLCILDCDRLRDRLPHHRIEVQVLRLGSILSHTGTHNGQINRFASLHRTDGFLGDFRVFGGGVESNFEVQVRVGIHEALNWRNREILVRTLQVPIEVRLHIAKVTHLDALG